MAIAKRSPDQSSSSIPVGAVAGGIVAGIALAIVIVAVWVRWSRSLEQSQHKVLTRKHSIRSPTALAKVKDGRPSTSSSLSSTMLLNGQHGHPRESYDSLSKPQAPAWLNFDEKRVPAQASESTAKFESRLERPSLLTQKLSSPRPLEKAVQQPRIRSILKPGQPQPPGQSIEEGVVGYKISTPRSSPRRLRHLVPQLPTTPPHRPRELGGAPDASPSSISGRLSFPSRSRILPRVAESLRYTRSSFMTATSASVYSEPDPINVAHGGEDDIPEDVEAIDRYLEYSETLPATNSKA